MPIYSIGKKRESLMFSAENYKSLVRKYMETMGFSQITDSYVEGHLSDMIFVNPDISLEKYFHVEIKAMPVGPNNKKFALELLDYLIEWLKLPNEKRFDFYVFVKELRNKKEFEKIFGSKYSVRSLKSWINKHKKELSKEKQDIIKKEEFKDIVSFFSTIKIFEVGIEQLTAAIKEKNKRGMLSLQRYAENLLLDTKRRGSPIKRKTTLFSNLVSVKPPDRYYVGKSKYKTKKRIYDIFNKKNIEIPPFLFYPEKQQISSFVPLDESNPLTTIVEGTSEEVPYEKLGVNPLFVKSLINQHLRRIFWKKGLRRIPNTNIYFFECLKGEDGEFQKRIITHQAGEKVVCTPYEKGEDGEKELNFIFHHAAQITTKYFWGNYCIEIIPKREYTVDGVTPIEGDSKDAIDRKFRNPMYNRSPNKLSEIRFWVRYLFKSDHYELPSEPWFKFFTFGELRRLPFDWSPQTLERGQALLKEFKNEVK
jgi:hypothetical protein